MLIETASLSGAILLIIGTATGMAWGLTQSGFSRALAAAMTGLPGGSATFIAVEHASHELPHLRWMLIAIDVRRRAGVFGQTKTWSNSTC